MPEQRTISIVDRAATNALWGHPGPSAVVLRRVTVPWVCPVCGGPRGEPEQRRYCEDGEWYSVDNWQNPCGHVDLYGDVLREAVVPVYKGEDLIV